MIIDIGIHLDKVKCKWYNTVKIALYIYIYIHIYAHAFNVKVTTTLTSVKQTAFPEKNYELNKEKKNLAIKCSLWCIHRKYIYIYIFTITHNLIRLDA
jgi:hypothetical protein